MKNMFPTHYGPMGRLLLPVTVASFCLLIAGPNLPNPLVPLYTDSFGLPAATQSLVFSSYLIVLVLTLVITTRFAGAHRAPLLLAAALAVAVVADAAMIVGGTELWALFIGRVLSGISVGLGTGAASAVALAAAGERARTAVGSGAVLGSLLGNMGAGLIGTLLPWPTGTTYVWHAALSLLTLAVLATVAWSRRRELSRRLGRSDLATSGRSGPFAARHRTAGFALGAMSWTAAGAVLALTPAAIRGTAGAETLVAAIAPATLLLGTAWFAQLATRPRIHRIRGWQVAALIVAGYAAIGAGIATHMLPLILIGAVVAGAGQGPAYSLGLATLTYGLAPADQARTTAAYAAVSYGACAVAVILVGLLATASSIAEAFLAAAGAMAIAGGAVALAAGPPQFIPAPPARAEAPA